MVVKDYDGKGGERERKKGETSALRKHVISLKSKKKRKKGKNGETQ